MADRSTPSKVLRCVACASRMDQLERLKKSNEELADAIRNGEGSAEELYVMFEAYEENREIIERLTDS